MSKHHSSHQIAKRYAHAMFELAGKDAPKLLPEVEQLLEISRMPDVVAFSSNPLLTRAEQAEVVKHLLESQKFATPLVDAVVRIALNRRLALLPDILNQFREMAYAAEDIMQVSIISAKALSEADIRTISDHLAASYGRKIKATASEDSSLIGGIMLKIQDKLIDYSAAGKLTRLGNYLKTT